MYEAACRVCTFVISITFTSVLLHRGQRASPEVGGNTAAVGDGAQAGWLRC